MQALAAYQAAAECSKDSKQVAEKVRLLTRRLQKQKATTQQPAAAVMQETGISEGSSGKRSCFKF